LENDWLSDNDNQKKTDYDGIEKKCFFKLVIIENDIEGLEGRCTGDS